MPLFYSENINDTTRLAVWEIAEPESFFESREPLLQAITHPHKRLQHLAGRFLLPFLFPGFPNSEIRVADTMKPYLPAEQYHFSISHCSNYAAAIVSSTHRVGIDAELLTTKLEKVQHKFLHPDEVRFINAQPQHLKLKLLSICWSAKEAMYKWYGLGEVDFKEMMRLMPFQFAQNGSIQAAFIKQDLQQPLTLHYCLFGPLTLVWVMS